MVAVGCLAPLVLLFVGAGLGGAVAGRYGGYWGAAIGAAVGLAFFLIGAFVLNRAREG